MTHTSVPVLSKALAGPRMVTIISSSLSTRLRIRHAGPFRPRLQSTLCTERGKYLAKPHNSEREPWYMADMHQPVVPGKAGDNAPASCSTRTHSSRRQNRTSYI